MAIATRNLVRTARVNATGSTAFRKCSGTALVEVLVAIFIMGVGMLSTTALFPEGALSLRRAVNEGRAGDDAVTLSTAIADFQYYEHRLPTSFPN